MEHFLSIKIIAGRKCNSCCVYCDVAPDDRADFDRFPETEKIIKTVSPVEIVVEGKETFMHPELLEWLKRFNIPVILFTNGTLLTRDFVKTMPDNFLIRVSLDGPQEVHDAQRKLKSNKSHFDAAIRGIDLLMTYQKHFTIGATITEDSIKHLNRIHSFFDTIPADKFVLTVEHRADDLEYTKRVYEAAKPIVDKWRDIRFELHSFHNGPEETLMKRELLLDHKKIQLNEIGFKTPTLKEWSWDEIDNCIEELTKND